MLPTEEQEQATFVQYLKIRNTPHFRVPNETYTKSFKQKAKNKALGVSPGVPDLFLIINHNLCAIEMKRKKGGVLASTQKEWLTKLSDAGVYTAVCRGAEQAIAFVENMMEGIYESGKQTKFSSGGNIELPRSTE